MGQRYGAALWVSAMGQSHGAALWGSAMGQKAAAIELLQEAMGEN